MRVIKISAIWCSSCLVMNKIWKNILKNCDIETVDLDYDMDEDKIRQYNVGDVLPVLIFYKGDREVYRVVGERTESELIEVIEEIGV